MASGAKNQLPLINVLGAPTLRDGSVGRWDGKESFFFDGFGARAAGRGRAGFARRRVPIEVSQKKCFHGRLGARGIAHDSPTVLV